MAAANCIEFLLIAEMGKGLNSLIQIRNLPGHSFIYLPKKNVTVKCRKIIQDCFIYVDHLMQQHTVIICIFRADNNIRTLIALWISNILS